MSDMASPACRGCQAPIIFAVVSNQAGRKPSRMPLNPDPDPAGNVACYRDETGTLRGRVLGKGQQAAGYERVYMPHFATCEAIKERTAQRGKWNAALAQHRQARRNNRGRRRQLPATPQRAGQLRLLPGGQDPERG